MSKSNKPNLPSKKASRIPVLDDLVLIPVCTGQILTNHASDVPNATTRPRVVKNIDHGACAVWKYCQMLWPGGGVKAAYFRG